MARLSFKDLILRESNDLIMINKPPLIATLADRVTDMNILELARSYDPDAQVCHRLDKETSGVLIIARNPETYRHISLQFQERKIKKIYHAVCEGIHDFNERADEPIRKLGNGNVCVDRRKGKEAYTELHTLRAYKKHTLVECRPETGRMHQIRIHLSYRQAPICADERYGGHPFMLSNIKPSYHVGREEEERPLIRRLALHAHAISFEDTDGEIVTTEAPYPKDFRVLLQQLEKNS